MTMLKKVDQGMATLMGYKQGDQQHNWENFRGHREENFQEEKYFKETQQQFGRGPNYPSAATYEYPPINFYCIFYLKAHVRVQHELYIVIYYFMPFCIYSFYVGEKGLSATTIFHVQLGLFGGCPSELGTFPFRIQLVLGEQ